MLKPAELTLEEMGDLAAIIPAADPEVKVRYKAIPDFESGASHATRRSIIPVCEPTLSGNELKYVTQAVETNWISSAGSFIRDFEMQFAEVCGTKYGIACANGTVAMHLAMATLGLEPGDEVIIPTFTMIATANAVTYCGATPVLVDQEPETWQMDINDIAAKITPRTKAIVPVHIYGHPVDMDPLMALAEEHGIMVIEDAAEAHGAEYKGRRAGGLGHAAGFSFYGNKII
ncbi:MAG: aminotransferase class I/II-fold pyridoxal phosphate-dependent enzyme, partial [Caldilineaceae bacterium]|nr:aminotransferase class I/II-fold pyridoxal phosphate-dependent enzyme [Caldilineaceae bacterium]